MLEIVPLGGIAARRPDTIDELLALNEAAECYNCFLEDGSVKGRNGYRSNTAAAFGVGGDAIQGAWRFRPSLTSARLIAELGGKVYTVTDPSSESLSDGVASLVATPFGAAANLSGAQLGAYFYLATDEVGVSWQRMDSAYALTAIKSFAQGSKPSLSAFSALAFTLFNGLVAPTTSGCVIQTNANTGMGGLAAEWRAFTKTNNGNDNPDPGSSAQFKFGADFDARAYDWLVISVTPIDNNNASSMIEIHLGRDVAGTPTDLTVVGATYDVPPVAGSPSLLYVPLSGLPGAVRQAVRYLKFVWAGTTGGMIGVDGYVFLPAKPLANPQKYYVTFYDSVSGQESPPTEALEVTIKDSDKLNGGVLSYVDCYLNSGFKTSGANADILSTGNRRIFNREAGKAMPTLADIGAIVTITGTTPAYTGPTDVRLWKDTETGRRLVGTVAYPGASLSYSITDNGGLSTLANTLWKAGGTPPRCTALAARAGRLIAGYGNRVYVSSFIPTAATSAPYPQFPDTPVIGADGYSFDIAPASNEAVYAITNGDALYIHSTEALYVMQEMDAQLFATAPNFYRVFNRGIVSRRGGLWAEDRYFWVAFDGVYMAANRSDVVELSQGIRRYYRDTFLPDSTSVIGYHERKLYVFTGSRYIRYDFVTDTWTAGDIAHLPQAIVCFSDPGASQQQMALFTTSRQLARWQRAATSDMMIGATAGTQIANWRYTTGYDLVGVRAKIRSMYFDIATEPVTVTVVKDASDPGNRQKSFGTGRHQLPLMGDLTSHQIRLKLTGSNTAQVKRLMWEREAIAADGA